MAILIVDDSADSRVLVKRLLEKNGFSEVITAETAFAAFDLLGMDRPACVATRIDLILMDVIMPDMDGIEACRLIKANRCLKDIPIIVITASDITETLERAFTAGAMDFITKPVKPLELKARVLSALKIKYEIDQRKAREAELVKVLEELENANRELSRLSSLDGLTGIANRRHFEQIYDMEWRRAARTGSELSVLFLDLDFFKYYNDTYGHQEGDDCLKQVAAAAGRVLKRPGDLLARYGGEEFVVILPETSIAGAVEVAEAIRQAIERCNIPHSASPVAAHVTVSVGVAGGRVTQEDKPSDFIARADKALYEAKHSGRNRVKVADC
ncbi:Response regulator, contains GGDEF domain [uncultured Sporomusa sp.]|uniref:Response regulator, contains GGDEF domain n=1 Tax=uncultured Sporomusa sp. TaxID=307249 RepID=A0A212LNS3_9FIRM|nr:diguanylate cyclase [uncultured Sporomusa sp.]SCM79069.1 Response regulator, contains GGDEF domain [uncultured Sporomusa sp.]